MPFVWIKLLISLSFKLVYGIILVSLFQAVQAMQAVGFYSLDQLAIPVVPIVMLVFVLPILCFIFRRYGRYLVRVGHIAVVTKIIETGEVPERQVSYGFSMVRQHFGRATVFFFLNKMVCRAIQELHAVVGNRLHGLGMLGVIANAFKRKFLKYVDECCLAYTFTLTDTGAFVGTIKGIVVYFYAWQQMAKAAAFTLLKVTVITWIFRIICIGMLYLGVVSASLPLVIISLFIFFVVGSLKTCMLDSYAMVTMLTTFLQESKTTDVGTRAIQAIANISTSFRDLVFQANRTEPFMTPDEEAELFVNRNQNLNTIV